MALSPITQKLIANIPESSRSPDREEAARKFGTEFLPPEPPPNSFNPEVVSTPTRILLQQKGFQPVVPPPIPEPTIGGEALRGLRAGIEQIGSNLTATAGVVAKALGAEETAQSLAESAQRQEEETQRRFGTGLTLDDVLDEPSLSAFAKFTARQLGQLTPDVVLTVAGMLAGGAGGVAAGERLAAALVKKGALSPKNVPKFLDKMKLLGAQAGAVGAIGGVETGATASEQFAATGEVQPGAAITAGAVKSALESVTPIALSRALGILPRAASGLLSKITSKITEAQTRLGRVAAAAGTALPLEATTEALQEAVDIAAREYVDENYDALGPEAAKRIRDAAVVGALGGLFFGGLGGFARAPAVTQEGQKALPPSRTQRLPHIIRGRDETSGPPISPQSPVPKLPPRPPTKLLPAPESEPIALPARTADGVELPGVTFIKYNDTNLAEATSEPFADFEVLQKKGTKVAVDVGELDSSRFSAALEDLFENGAPRVPEEFGTVSEDTYAAFLDQVAKYITDLESGKAHPDTRRLLLKMYDNFLKRGLRIKPTTLARFVVHNPPEGPSIPFTKVVPLSQGADIVTYDPEKLVIFDSALPGFKSPKEPLIAFLVSHPDPEIKTRERAIGAPRLAVSRTILKKLGAKSVVLPLQFIRRAMNVIGNPPAVDALVRVDTPIPRPRAGISRVEAAQIFKALLKNKNTTPLDIAKAYVLADGVFPSKKYQGESREILVMPEKSLRLSAQPIPEIDAFFPNTFGGTANKKFSEHERTRNLVTEKGTPLPAFDDHMKALHGRVLLALSPEDWQKLPQLYKTKLKKIVKVYRELMKDLGIENRGLVVTLLRNVDDDIEAMHTNLHPDAAVIAFTKRILSQANTPEVLMNVASHEWGHFMALTTYKNLPSDIQQGIYRDFITKLSQARFGGNTVGSFLIEGSSLIRFASSLRFKDLPITDVNDPELHWTSFSEFVAEETARWFSQDRVALTIAEKYFTDIARGFKRALDRFSMALGVENFEPGEGMKRWIAALRARQLREDAGLDFEDVVAKDIEDKARRGSPFPNYPRTPVLPRRVDNLFRKLKIDRKQTEEVKDTLDRFSWLIKWGYTIQQAADLNPHVRSLQQYVELVRAWYNAKMFWMSLADERAREWRALSKKQKDSLAHFIFDIDRMSYLREDESPRLPTEEEIAALARKWGVDEQGLALYGRIKEDFERVLDKIEEVSIAELKDTFKEDQLGLELEMQKLQEEMARLRSRPYFPHARFGDYVVVVRNTETGVTEYREQFDTIKQARAAVGELRKQFPGPEYSIGPSKIPRELRPFRGFPPVLLRAMRRRLNLTPEQEIALEEMIVEFSPSKSFRKHLTTRRNVPGFSFDAMRAYADYFWHGSNFLARLEYGGPLQKAVDEGHKEAARMRDAGFDASKRIELVDMMQNHLNNIMDPKSDWAQLRSLAFMWWLGFSPASAVLNFTQIPLVGYPYLAARYGDARAVKALKDAVKDFHNIYRKEPKGLSESFIKAKNRAIRENVIDASQATELAGIAEGSNLARLLPGDKLHRWQAETMHWAAFLFQQSEKINRHVLFKAGWDLAMQTPLGDKYLMQLRRQNALEMEQLKAEGFTDREAVAFLAGRDATLRTQFEYGAHARPRFMQGKKATLFTFFMFTQNMVYFAAHSPGRTRFLLMMLFAGGLMGLPGAEDLAAIARFIGQRLFGVDFDIERETREFVTALAGDTVAPDVILHGVSRVGFGIPAAADLLGLPIPMVDFSASIGLGRIVPGLSEIGSPTLDYERLIARTTTQAAGATFGIGANLMKFFLDQSLDITDAKRWERALPRTFRNVLRAARFAKEGRERSRTGATVVSFDATDPEQLAEIVAQALGFTPTRLTREWNRIVATKEFEGYWKIRRGILLRQYDHAMEVGDPEARADVLAAIRRFNNEVPLKSLHIRGKTLSLSHKQRKRKREEQEKGLSEAAQVVKRLFPEAQPLSTRTLPQT